MREIGAFEVGFYDEHQGTVSSEHYDLEFPLEHFEILSLALFALRQWRNSGKNPISQASAYMFLTLRPQEVGNVRGWVDFLPHPGDPDLAERIESLTRTLSRLPMSLLPALELLTSTDDRRAFQLVGDQGRARRRFVGTIEARHDVFTLHTQVKGFGLFGSGLGYYAPASLFVLLYYLASLHQGDEQVTTALAEVARNCARAWLDGEVTLANQSAVATALAAGAVRDHLQGKGAS